MNRKIEKEEPVQLRYTSLRSRMRKFNAKTFFAGLIERKGTKAYLIISGGDVVSKLIGRSPVVKEKLIKVIDIEGIPHTVLQCRPRFARTIQRSKNTGSCYGSLSQFLAENDIKNFFYEIWMKHHNLESIAKRNREKVEGAGKAKDEDHGYIAHLAGGMTRRDVAISSTI